MSKFENKIYLFDMDGTLTPAMLKMTESFAEEFRLFLGNKRVFIVSGSDIGKIKTQIPEDLFLSVSGVYASLGNEFYEHGERKYWKEFVPDEKLITFLEYCRKNTKYKGMLYPNYIERRCGMINFSVLGRNCPYEERIKYKKWDDGEKERIGIQKKLQNAFPDMDIDLGGNIGIDIVPKGFGKEQVADDLRKKFPSDSIVFAGDRTAKGGNDYRLCERLVFLGSSEVIRVSGPEELVKKLKEI